MIHDVVVIGTGVAGATAGALLARKGLKVAMVGQAPSPRNDAGIGWGGRRAADLLAEVGVEAKDLLNRSINDVTFFDADLVKSARPNTQGGYGYVIDRAALENRLLEAAAAAGAEVHHQSKVADVIAREDAVELRIEDRSPLRGRIALLAVGRRSRLPERVGLPRATAAEGLWTAYLSAKSGKRAKDRPAVNAVLGLTARGGCAIAVASRDRLAVAVHVPGSRAEAIAWLSRMCQAMAHKGLIPDGLESQANEALVVPPLIGALEMESHVAKHTLLIGEAGGFVSFISHEGLVPAMWSATIAADVVEAALKAPRSQDVLMTFDTRWRLEMADYLRQPNTDMQFLVPLVFSNQPMADRMAAAFFLGENI